MTKEEREEAIVEMQRRKQAYIDSHTDAYLKKHAEAINAYDLAINALREQEPCEDCISRKAVMAIAKEECETAIIPYKRFVNGVNSLPPVTPKPKTDVLDKIKAEIESHIIDSNGLDFNSALCIAIEIIDKYKTESEDKE